MFSTGFAAKEIFISLWKVENYRYFEFVTGVLTIKLHVTVNAARRLFASKIVLFIIGVFCILCTIINKKSFAAKHNNTAEEA